jgi:ethanolamine utilization microcompartment shell protein EutS
VCKDLKYVYVKSVQVDLQKCITWPKTDRKRKLGWDKACVEIGICPKKTKHFVKTRESSLFHYYFNSLQFLGF